MNHKPWLSDMIYLFELLSQQVFLNIENFIGENG